MKAEAPVMNSKKLLRFSGKFALCLEGQGNSVSRLIMGITRVN